MHEEEQTCRIEAVVTKYKAAGEIVNRTLDTLIKKCVAGASVIDLCELGDKLLTDQTSLIYKNKDIRKGIAFPTCVCVNNCICHFSPLKSEPAVELKEGDVVKLDLGAHIDGFIAVAAHTLVIGATKEKKVSFVLPSLNDMITSTRLFLF